VAADLIARFGAVQAGHQKIVVPRVLMPDRSRDRELDRPRVECSPGGATTNTPAPALSRMPRDRLGAITWATREQPDDLRRHPCLQLHIARRASLGVTLAPARSSLVVRQTLRFGFVQCGVLDQDALPLIALASATETHDDSGQAARRPGAASQRGVTGWSEDEMVHVRTGHAHRAAVIHDQQTAVVVAAVGAGPSPECRDNDEIRPAAWSLGRGARVSIDHGPHATEIPRAPDRGALAGPCPVPGCLSGPSPGCGART